MMTVSEAERRASHKGRSASFCATGQLPLTLASAHSSSDIRDGGGAGYTSHQVLAFMQQAANGSAPPPQQQQQQQHQQSPRTRLKSSQTAARRSQSCRVQGSRPPRAVRRYDTPPGSAGKLDYNQEFDRLLEIEGTPPPGEDPAEKGSYNPFLKKVGSCGRLMTLAPDEEAESSPTTLRRTASARRPPPSSSGSPTHSPTPTRVTRPSGSSSSIKGRTPSRRGATPTSNSARRATPAQGYLEVRPSDSSEALDPDAYLLRNFQTTTKGIVNRGDSFRRRRSRSNSIQPPHEAPPLLPSLPPQVGDISSAPGSPELPTPTASKDSPSEHFRMVVVGATGVGKTALMNQFRTSECINAYDCATGMDEKEESVSIVLNSIESEIIFINATTANELQEELQRTPMCSGWLVVYSVTDKSSFQRAAEDLGKMQAANLIKGRVAILAGNKCELVRSRAVSFDDGRDLAVSYGAKFMEISVGMNHKCDDLLVGILHQLRLKEEAASVEMGSDDKEKSPWTRNRSLMRASMKAKRLVNRIMGKSDSKHKQCEDFLN